MNLGFRIYSVGLLPGSVCKEGHGLGAKRALAVVKEGDFYVTPL
jgi:hypothetical protein